jgi:hypothetical protein
MTTFHGAESTLTVHRDLQGAYLENLEDTTWMTLMTTFHGAESTLTVHRDLQGAYLVADVVLTDFVMKRI